MGTKFSVKWMVRTAALLALTLIWQSLRYVIGTTPVSTYLIGTLVNTTVIVSAGALGIVSGAIIAIAAPLVALLQGHAQAPMVPYIMAGNLILVLVFALLGRRNWWAAVGVGAVLKAAVIMLGMAFVMMGKQGAPFAAVFGAAFSQQIVQLVTALIGGIVAKPVLEKLPQSLLRE